ncbi:MAG: DNA methylase N-4/N-6 domain-containing protein [Candidatus Berkelbacteria bacterium Athens1014_28]|uniref:site-specific DNA-methyltransferase (cytosine-N(4)-specific) n=1 Tax=Candidatus Berkelbacteria bacterium Athens1014_28 TaxID=2017145 RepID=A0A554LPB1_9BACT|nr:MAG: DNA methylase N-4/N-6 domain-containing protein [Candidatus Berkelbacteria bacterium Athens1014_28]
MADGIYLNEDLVTINDACRWASKFLNRTISSTNISYLIQYGKIRKHKNDDQIKVDINELKNYYHSSNGIREIAWKNKLGDDLNWALSFDNYRESDTTKHVHRLHPYKGKFIPQLVEYFLDDHIDNFKKEIYFRSGDVVLDPFMGSGTTLVQANELNLHSIGVDVSSFNCLISDIKLEKYDFGKLSDIVKNLITELNNLKLDNNFFEFEKELNEALAKFNFKCFPSPDYKREIYNKKINEKKYSSEKEAEFLDIYKKLLGKYNIKLEQEKLESFLDKWYSKNSRQEINFVFDKIKKIGDKKNKKILAVILSRTIRSCRATTHSDLATLIRPQLTTYYCFKHKKICKPLFSIKKMFSRYTVDTLFRLKKFDNIRTEKKCCVIPSDSRNVDILVEVKKRSKDLFEKIKKDKIDGIFTSPPYVGQIDYHEQHAYAYDLLGYKRKDELEIGPLCKGQGLEAKQSYADGISDVLTNCKKYLKKDANVFLVANDKYNLYPQIASRSEFEIVNQFKRPVLNRTERDKSPYSEIIFHLKGKL